MIVLMMMNVFRKEFYAIHIGILPFYFILLKFGIFKKEIGTKI